MNPPSRILIVDDEPITRETLEALLSGAGYQLTTAASGAEGLAKAEAIRPDLILLDVMMPGMDGFETCRRLRSNEHLGLVPVLLVTALDDHASRLRGLEAGADDFIAKPFDAAELQARVRTITRLDRYRRLLAEQARFERLIELSPDGILIAEGGGSIRLANPAMRRMLGYATREAMLGQPMLSILASDEAGTYAAGFDQVIARPAAAVSFETVLRRVDGTTFSAEINAGYFEWDGHAAVQLITRDITDRVRAEQARQHAEREIRQLNEELERRVRDRTAQLEAANRELESFSFSVSHDLRAPLRSVDGYSQALLEDCAALLDETGREHIQRIRNASQRMAQLIDGLLSLSRLTRLEMQHERLSLSALARGIVLELQQRNPERQVEFVIADGLEVKADARLMRAALENLLENAWKYTSGHARARIEFGALPQTAGPPAYFVRDDGAGFDMAYADRLFVAFQRLHSAQEFPGDGIGLATVQRIVHRHGGRVWAEGAPGQGAVFYFSLP
jgi:PAS domain S-box-containing protein